MRIKRRYKLVGMAALMMTAYLSGCATTPPSDVTSACAIFKEHKSWYRHMKKAEKRWGMPVHIQLAIMRQESNFVHNAKPPRKKFLWIFPGSRGSSAYGYAQAQDTTWEWYKSEARRRGADRNDFKDAADFISWYGTKSREMSGISLWDPYNQYLAYHEGQGGYNRKTWESKSWLLSVASKVERNAKTYGAQLKACESKLDRGFSLF